MNGREAKAKFQGCYVATLTPFDGTDRLDTGVVSAHAQWLVEHGIQGLCPAGTTGEFLYLTDDEKRRLIKATVEAVKKRVPVIAGVWAARPAAIADLARAAENAGADAVFLQTPIYYPVNDDALFAYYAAVREATSLPVFAYSIPQYAANEISLACLERLLNAGVVVGIKDSSGKAERVGELVRRFGDSAVVFAASDSFASQGRKLGADGFISAIANVAPGLFARLWAGDESLQAAVNALRDTLKQVGSIPALKMLLALHGFAFGASRLPFSSPTAEQQERLKAVSIPAVQASA
jgi:4-hydroxy-tetrahydrodipicolinate synthase